MEAATPIRVQNTKKNRISGIYSFMKSFEIQSLRAISVWGRRAYENSIKRREHVYTEGCREEGAFWLPVLPMFFLWEPWCIVAGSWQLFLKTQDNRNEMSKRKEQLIEIMSHWETARESWRQHDISLCCHHVSCTPTSLLFLLQFYSMKKITHFTNRFIDYWYSA